ncbi:MAG: hypothetical protein ACXWYM_00105 [Candidatus Binatia bacterium]
MSSDECREEFEAWCDSTGWINIGDHGDGYYRNPVVHEKWLAWQAAWNRAPSPELAAERERADKYETALLKIKEWAEAYPVEQFKPVSSDELKIISALLDKYGHSMGNLHASWARHILDGIGKIAATEGGE